MEIIELTENKKDLKEKVCPTSDVLWRDVRDFFKRRNFFGFTKNDLMAAVYRKRLSDRFPNCRHYDSVNMAQCALEPETRLRSEYVSYFKALHKEFGPVFDVLMNENLIEYAWVLDGEKHYSVAKAGHTLKMQKMVKPISRALADELLERVLQKAKEINDDPELFYGVACIHVFGSYLSEKQVLGDLDLGVSVKCKPQYKRYRSRKLQQMQKLGIKSWERHISRLLEFKKSISVHPLNPVLGMVEDGNAVSKSVFEWQL